MKKVSNFSVERMPAFVAYLVAAICAVGIFIAGIHCLFVGIGWFLVGCCLDPEFNGRDIK